jgi:hypothetical protein
MDLSASIVGDFSVQERFGSAGSFINASAQ